MISTPSPSGRVRSGAASAQAKRARVLGKDPDMFTEPTDDRKENNRRFAENCRKYVARKHGMAALLLLWLCCFPAGGTIVPDRPDQLRWTNSVMPGVSYLVFRGPTNGLWIATNPAPAGAAGPLTVSLYPLTNIALGRWWFQVTAVSNGVQSDPTPAIQWTNAPDPPTGLSIESSSNGSAILWVPLPFGTALVESSADVIAWSPFLSLKNLSIDPAREIGVRVLESDPRKFYRAVPPPAPIRLPPTP